MDAAVTSVAMAALVADGLLAGLSLDKVIVQLPAPRKIGVTAYAAYARAADLGNGIAFYPAVGVGEGDGLIGERDNQTEGVQAAACRPPARPWSALGWRRSTKSPPPQAMNPDPMRCSCGCTPRPLVLFVRTRPPCCGLGAAVSDPAASRQSARRSAT